MKRRTTIVKQLNENIASNLEFAGFDEKLGNAVSEAYRRGLAAAYAQSLCMLLDESTPEWLVASRIGHDQAARITTLRTNEETVA